MAANIMDMMRQIQRDLADQKEYTRNLHVINRNLNEKLTLIDERMTELPKVLVTVKKLEEQVKKNNMALFGTDDTEIVLEKTVVPYKSDINDKEKNFCVRNPDERMESPEATELTYPLTVKLVGETEFNDKNKREDGDAIEHTEFTANGLGGSIKAMEEITQPIKFPNCPFCKQNAAKMSSIDLNADQTYKLEDKLNKIIELYQCDMQDLRESIKNVEASIKTLTEEAQRTVREQETIQNTETYSSAEQVNHINAELKRIIDMNQSQAEHVKKLINDVIANKDATNVVNQENTDKSDKLISICTELKLNADTNQSELRQMKEYIKYFVAKKLPVEAITASKQKTVQISPTYFSPDQISKLNSELKRIADIYQGTEMFPVIEVVPETGDEHLVMKLLRQGVFYNLKDTSQDVGKYKVKLGTDGLKRTDVIDMITDYPNLTINEVVREWLISTKKWVTSYQKYDFSRPLIFDKKNGRFIWI